MSKKEIIEKIIHDLTLAKRHIDNAGKHINTLKRKKNIDKCTDKLNIIKSDISVTSSECDNLLCGIEEYERGIE